MTGMRNDLLRLGSFFAVALCMAFTSCSDDDDAEADVVGGKDSSGSAYVDLGLPSGTLWATCNVGADAPEDLGYYFAWGETEPKADYSWETYKHGCQYYPEGSYYKTTKIYKYNNNDDDYYGAVDNKIVLESIDDAARQSLGAPWRMPTVDEVDELRNSANCVWKWTTDAESGVSGYTVTSRSNGKSIFLPAAGKSEGKGVSEVGETGQYWTSYLYNDKYPSPERSCILFFRSSIINSSTSYRVNGLVVRPVYDKK